MLRTLFLVFLKIGAFTFGGGYAMIALLENEFVEKRDWLEQKEFMDMVAIAESTPGPVAVNSATYIGYKMAGTAGAAVATLGVCLPSFGIIYLISLFFDQFLSLRLVGCAFRGIQVCVIYLILSVIGDLNARRGQIQGMEAMAGTQRVNAFVPLAQMFGYATDLRSKTQGRGQYVMEPSHYEPVPKNIADQIIAGRTKA